MIGLEEGGRSSSCVGCYIGYTISEGSGFEKKQVAQMMGMQSI